MTSKKNPNTETLETSGLKVAEDIANAQSLKNQKHVTIIIASGEGDANQGRVQGGINGYTYSIMRDVPVSVPIAVYKMLKSLKEERPIYSKDELGRVVGFKEVSRFSISLEMEEAV